MRPSQPAPDDSAAGNRQRPPAKAIRTGVLAGAGTSLATTSEEKRRAAQTTRRYRY